MPAYDVKCDGCGHAFEVTHGINESHPDQCPKCESKGQIRTVFNSVPLMPDTYSPMAPRRGRGRGIGNKSKLALILVALMLTGCSKVELPFRGYPSESTESIGPLWDAYERDALVQMYANKTVVFQVTATIDGILVDCCTYSECHLEPTQ